MQKKVVEFEIRDMLPIGLTFVVLGIGLTYGLNVQSDLKDELGTDICAARAENRTIYHWQTGECSDNTTVSLGWKTEVGAAEYNASSDAITGVGKIPEKMPLIATVVVAAIIIGILVRYLLVRFA